MMKISSADFCKLTLQEVADFLLDQEKHTALCKGLVDGRLYNLVVKLELDDEVEK
jgi:hypothetical protein